MQRHTITHLPFRSRCLACVLWKARDPTHEWAAGQEVRRIPGNAFDYTFLGPERETSTIPALVARSRRTKIIFARTVPREGLAHERSARDFEQDIRKLSDSDECDGKLVRRASKEVKRHRREPTWVQKSGVGEPNERRGREGSASLR